MGTSWQKLNLKAVLHRATCNNNFSRNNVARKIEHRCEFLNSNQKLATRCRVKCCAKNRLRHHVTRCSIFRATLWREKSTLQVAPCNTALRLIGYVLWKSLSNLTFQSWKNLNKVGLINGILFSLAERWAYSRRSLWAEWLIKTKFIDDTGGGVQNRFIRIYSLPLPKLSQPEMRCVKKPTPPSPPSPRPTSSLLSIK